MQDYEKLKVFQRSDAVVERVYAVTQTFPSAELYGLSSQLRRAAVSVPANIVEGAVRGSGREFARHLSIALGSAAEVGYLLRLSGRLRYAEPAVAKLLAAEYAEICRMLNALYLRVLQQSAPARTAEAKRGSAVLTTNH